MTISKFTVFMFVALSAVAKADPVSIQVYRAGSITLTTGRVGDVATVEVSEVATSRRSTKVAFNLSLGTLNSRCFDILKSFSGNPPNALLILKGDGIQGVDGTLFNGSLTACQLVTPKL